MAWLPSRSNDSTAYPMKTILCFALMCLFAPCSYAAGIVQGANATQAGATSVSATFTGPTVAGNYLICGVASANTADTFTISDTQRNVWGIAVGINVYNGDGVHAVQAFEAKNIAGGPDTITLTGTLSTTHWLGCQEWYQVGLADIGSLTHGTTANPLCGSLAVTTVNSGIMGFIINTATPNTAPVTTGTQAPYIMTGNAVANLGTQYSVADQSGSMQPKFTNATAGTWTCISLELADNSGFVQNPNTKYGLVAYGSKYLASPYNPLTAINFTSWAHKIYYLIVNPETGSPYPYSANAVSGAYEDSQGIYQYQWYSTRSAGLANAGWDPERFIFHFGSDYEVTTNWPNKDEFDYFDGGNVSSTNISGVNGALIYNGTSYNDVTTTLYNGTCGPACTLSNSSYFLYLGYAVPFDRMNFVFTTPMTGGSAIWQYWNGTVWNNFTPATDGTSGLTANGQIIFTPPSDWTMTTVNAGTNSKYWVRLSTGTPPVPPVLRTVKGDDWFAAVVIDYNGTTYTNCEIPDSNCLTGSTSLPLINTRYFGGSNIFSTVNPTVGVANVGGVITWSYWNGTAWTTFTPLADATNGFTIAGRNTIVFPTLTGWAKTFVPAENNSMFYVRAQISGQTTAPTLTDFDGIPNDRGWCPACTHVNSGISGVNADLAYDPNPPATQSAHFRHQARWQSIAQDYGALNTSDQQGSPAIYTYPQAMAGRWNVQHASGAALYNGAMFDNAGGGFQAANMVTPSSNFYNNVIEMNCYPTCGTANPNNWASDMLISMQNLTNLWHNPTSVVYGLNPGTYDNRKTLVSSFNITGLTTFGTSTPNLRGKSDVASIENAATYAINQGAGFDVPIQYMDSFLTANGEGGGTCPSGGCNTTGSLGFIELHDEVAPIYGNFRVIRGSASAPVTTWHTIDTSSVVPMAILAAYKIGENAHTMLFMQPGGDIYLVNDDYYYWGSTTTTLTAPVTVGRSDTQTISVANAAACPAIPGNTGEFGGMTWMQFGTLTGPGVNGTADIMSLRSTGTNTYTGTNGNGSANFVNAYPAGTVVRCAVIGHLSNSAPPPMSQMFAYMSWTPAMGIDLGAYNTSGWMNGNRDLNFIPGAMASGNPASCGTNGCPPVERRDFMKAVVLFRPIQGTTLDSETQTPSTSISLTSAAQMFTPPYYRLNVDGTTGPAITSVTLKAGEAAILMTAKTTTTPAISSLTPNAGPVGTLVTISGNNFTATPGTVTFGGVTAAFTSWSDTSITVTVPAGATTGNVVVTANGQASAGVLFTVTPAFSNTGFVLPIP